ncbi:FMN reductase [NAD(P)H] [Enterococcus sp. AZ135]|uniref:nitroreductase family protein n=1 Tax=unclassified Enterococcus TaxID=2608891 RepID=UPI003F237381
MNEALTVLKQHGTIRDFESDYKVTDEQLNEIIRAAKQAPSWMNGQAYSIVVFEDQEKEKFAKLLLNETINTKNSETITHSNLLLLFNIDLSLYGLSAELEDEIEPLLIGSVDAALAMENALIAAESLGFGTCVIGNLRASANDICQTYDYPDYVFPLLGLVIGKPNKKSSVKPRVSNSANVFRPEDLPSKSKQQAVDAYNSELSAYAAKSGYKTSDWQQRFQDYYQDKQFLHTTKEQLKKQKLI